MFLQINFSLKSSSLNHIIENTFKPIKNALEPKTVLNASNFLKKKHEAYFRKPRANL